MNEQSQNDTPDPATAEDRHHEMIPRDIQPGKAVVWLKDNQMLPNSYQQLASRTELDYLGVLARLTEHQEYVRLLHAIIGMMGELGELATHLERVIYYGKVELDPVNIAEELGDANWYHALALNSIQQKFADVLERNINKLRVRFPEKFDSDQALEHNRDRDAERKALEGSPLGPAPAHATTQRAQDDGPNYEVLTTQMQPIADHPLPSGSQPQRLCTHCKQPLSDELVRRINDPNLRTHVFRCPNCTTALCSQDVQFIGR